MADSSVVSYGTPEDPKVSTSELLFRASQQMGLRPVWIVPNGLFAVTYDGIERYINSSRSLLNTHTAISLAKNKHATRLILERHGLPNISYLRPSTMHEAEEFLSVHGKIIAKPVGGFGAQDIHIVTQPEELHGLSISRYILEKYIAGREMRYLVLRGRVIGVHESEYGTSVDEHRALKRISFPSDSWDASLLGMSIQISQILGLQFAAVDYLISPDGRQYVLEVNTVPGLKWFHAPTSGPVVDVARQFMEAFVADIRVNTTDTSTRGIAFRANNLMRREAPVAAYSIRRVRPGRLSYLRVDAEPLS